MRNMRLQGDEYTGGDILYPDTGAISAANSGSSTAAGSSSCAATSACPCLAARRPGSASTDPVAGACRVPGAAAAAFHPSLEATPYQTCLTSRPAARAKLLDERHLVATDPAAATMAGRVVIVLVLLIIAAGVTDWNFARGFVSRMASRQLHRSVAIDGALRVHLLSSAPKRVGRRPAHRQPGLGRWRQHAAAASPAGRTAAVATVPRPRGVAHLELDQPQLSLRRDSMQRATGTSTSPASPPLRIRPGCR